MADYEAMLRLRFTGDNSLFSVRCPEMATFGASAGWRKARPVSGELRLRNGAAEKRINGGCQVVVDRETERSEAGRNSPESGTWGGAKSFGVSASERDSPKVCAPREMNQLIKHSEIFTEPSG